MKAIGVLIGTALALISISTFGSPARAEQSLLLESGAWRAIEATQGGRRMCFVISAPTQRLPPELNRDPGSFFVTLKRGKAATPTEVSIEFGYRLSASGHAAVVDSRSFDLMSSGGSAWVRSETDEQDIVAAMKAGSVMKVTAHSARGNATTDVYDLGGFTAALGALQARCRP